MSKKSQEKEDGKKIHKWQIKVGMNGNFKYIGINLSGLIQEVLFKYRIPYVFLLK